MNLSSSTYETLCDLLELRINSFLVTNPKEALQLASLYRCREELLNMQKDLKSGSEALRHQPLRLPRRLDREIRRIRKTASA